MDNLSSENKKGPLGTSVQVRLTAQDIIFGPGKAMLLEYIEATGSIQVPGWNCLTPREAG